MKLVAKKPKKIVKLAVIRSNDDTPCPFGLSIPYACRSAGELITQMAPVDVLEDMTEEEKALIEKANKHLLMWKNPETRCIYAGKLFKDNDVVECNWLASDAGTSQRGALVGSPFYYKHYSGIGLDGLYSYPLGYYTDNSIDRGMYYGMYSLESAGSKEDDE
ncbi:hypothetical protein LCGC14_0390000 [marine sediment metagenome]|uniref:Uncharacterized protein n=1 Tax=marine sediment metagenome TaxID=412755 RepID=A0A0F9W8U2_9ZZZZ